MIIRLNLGILTILFTFLCFETISSFRTFAVTPLFLRKSIGARNRLSLFSSAPGGNVKPDAAIMDHGHGHGHGHGQSSSENTSNKPYSFVQDEMRPYAMKLHTRDQAPKEGQQKAQTPFTKWQPSRANYLQFLVDSLVVYEAFDAITQKYDLLAPLRHTGLERSNALKEDIKWMTQYDTTLSVPPVSTAGTDYVAVLHRIAADSMPKFLCHYYNHYFAHTAGGRMIGAKMADLLLESKVLHFYQWEGDVKVLLEETRRKIDDIAVNWTSEEKQACLEETMATFQYGGSLMASMRPPSSSGSH